MTLCTVWMNVEGVRSCVMGLGWLIKLYPPSQLLHAQPRQIFRLWANHFSLLENVAAEKSLDQKNASFEVYIVSTEILRAICKRYLVK